MEEIWKDIKGYEGLYQVSNLGRVKSLEHWSNSDNYKKMYTGKILTGILVKTNGYLKVTLSKNGKTNQLQIHRLVAEAFIPNVNNYPVVNHKDENKLNNCINNLEWCTYKHNNNYGNRSEKYSKTRKMNKTKNVYQYDLEGNLINIFKNIKEAKKNLNIFNDSISRCCRKIQKTAGGFKWEYRN